MKKLTPDNSAQLFSSVDKFTNPTKQLMDFMEEDRKEAARLNVLIDDPSLDDKELALLLNKIELLNSRDTIGNGLLLKLNALSKQVAKFNLGAEALSVIDGELYELEKKPEEV